MVSKIKDVENKFPAFSILLNIMWFNHQKRIVQLSEVVRNIYESDKIAKADEQRIRNIVLSLRQHGVKKAGKDFLLLTSDNNGDSGQKIAYMKVNEDALVNYLFEFIGEYYLVDLGEDFYDKIQKEKEATVKKLIELYLKHMSSEPSMVLQMCFSDAIPDLEQLIVTVSELEQMKRIRDLKLKGLVEEWSGKLKDALQEELKKFPLFE